MAEALTLALAIGVAILLVLAIRSLATVIDERREREALDGVRKALGPETERNEKEV